MSINLYPTSRKFPFDETMEKIVKEMERRDFRAPNISVEMGNYRGYEMVREITGPDFRLHFSRVQGRISHDTNDTAAISDLTIPKKLLTVYEDNSGPTLHIYVGDNWEQDRERFERGFKRNSKLDHKPRTYLKYIGAWRPEGRTTLFGGAVILKRPYETGIAPYFVHDNDLGREYDPQGEEPFHFTTGQIFHEFTEFFEQKLEEIKRQTSSPTSSSG